MAKNIRTYHLSEPLQGAAAAKLDINMIDGNLAIDPHAGGLELASGELQYLENQDPPAHSQAMSGGLSALTIRSSKKGQPWIRFPWSACNEATVWQIHLNPTVSMDITAHSGGGNVRLDLTGMAVTRLAADTGGGNMEVILPGSAGNLQVEVKTGAGNVTIHIPGGCAARIHATSGLGKVILEAPLSQVSAQIYQTPGYDSAVEKIEIRASSGAGNVSIKESIGHPETVI
jgi:hypothetical protein